MASKALLLNEMVRQEVTASELARRMGTIPQEINRIIDLRHTTKIDRIAQALDALGKRLELSVA
jgi:antitoxin HicB